MDSVRVEQVIPSEILKSMFEQGCRTNGALCASGLAKNDSHEPLPVARCARDDVNRYHR